MDSNMVRRVGFAVVAIPAVLLVIWSGGGALAALLAISAQLGAREVYGLAERHGVRSFQLTGLLSATLIPFVMYAGVSSGGMHRLLDGWWWYLLPLLLLVLLMQA